MRRMIPLSIALALAGTTLVAGTTSTSNALQAATPKVRTDYGMTATSYGTRVIGGPLPVDSSETAYQSLSCTNKAGIDRSNNVAQANLGGLGTARGVQSRTWTTKVGGTVSSYSSHDIAHITLLESDFGKLDINGLSSQARAYHDAKGFHAAIKSKILSITFTPKDGDPVGLDIPSVGKPVTVPGLLRISLGVGRKVADSQGAEAVTSALDIRLFPGSENEVKLIFGQTKATITGGIKSGLFYGNAVGAHASVLGDLVQVGMVPLQPMPCRGTQGKVIIKETAAVNLADQLKISGVAAAVQGSQNKSKATGVAASHIASIDLGGRLQINGIRGVASAVRKDGKVVTSSEGTKVIEIIVDGEPREILGDGLEIPGLAKLESKIVKRTKTGISVVALRITLLDGSLATIDLGSATVGIKGTGKRRR